MGRWHYFSKQVNFPDKHTSSGMCFATIPALHNWQSYMPYEAKGAINRIVGQTFISKTPPCCTEAELWAEPLKTKRVVCPAFLGEKVNKNQFVFFPHSTALVPPLSPQLEGEQHTSSQADCVNVWTHWEWVMVLLIVHMQAQVIYSGRLVYLERETKPTKQSPIYSNELFLLINKVSEKEKV